MKKRSSKLLILFLIIVSLTIRLYIGSKDIPTLIEKILIDDSFYSFSIGKNIAKGNGITYNGMDKTNGFQPFWVFLISVFFVIEKNIYSTVNLILFFASFVDVLTMMIIFLFAQKLFNQKTAFLASAIYGLNPFIIFQTLNGLECVLDTFFVTLVFFVYYSYKNKPFKKKLILGLLLGLSLLTRTDKIFLLISIFLCILWNKKKDIKLTLLTCFTIGLITITTFSPFLLWNLFTFGRITLSSFVVRYNMNHGIFPFFDLKPPTSLDDHLKLIRENTYRGLGIILHQFGIIEFEFFSASITLPIFIVLILLFSLKELKKLNTMVLYSIFIFGFYCFYFLGVQIRYFTPFMPLLFILFSIGLQNFCKSNKLLYTIFTLFILVLFLNGYKQWENGYFSWQREIYEISLWLRENAKDIDIIACFSSGIPTYFSEKRVVNMDGVLNFEAIEALKNKSVIQYMRSKNMTIWIDSVYFNQTVADAYKKGLRFNILENNLWLDFLGEGKENIILIEQKEGIYKHLRGFEMLVVFFKAKIT